MSSGCAACPVDDMMYFGLSSVLPDVLPVVEAGSVDGIVLYVYGRVVAVGREMKGETVKGICASNGWDPVNDINCSSYTHSSMTYVYHASRSRDSVGI